MALQKRAARVDFMADDDALVCGVKKKKCKYKTDKMYIYIKFSYLHYILYMYILYMYIY